MGIGVCKRIKFEKIGEGIKGREFHTKTGWIGLHTPTSKKKIFNWENNLIFINQNSIQILFDSCLYVGLQTDCSFLTTDMILNLYKSCSKTKEISKYISHERNFVYIMPLSKLNVLIFDSPRTWSHLILNEVKKKRERKFKAGDTVTLPLSPRNILFHLQLWAHILHSPCSFPTKRHAGLQPS